MRLACRLGLHRFERRRDSDRLSPLGNPAPAFYRCLSCGREKDVPVAKEHPDAPLG